jgi:molybdenum cofactor cytidylyltransferase
VTLAAVLLAAGRGSRFGAPKLAAKLGGKPLALHAAATLAQLPLALRIAVVGPDTPNLTANGFDCLQLDPPGALLSRSLQLGLGRAEALGATQVLIALADMPLVPLSHFQALLETFDGVGIATRANGNAMPPAIFGTDLLAPVGNLDGDQGARALLQGLPVIDLAADLALDIDTPADLERAERLLKDYND